jgi:iron complex transport system permease protein
MARIVRHPYEVSLVLLILALGLSVAVGSVLVSPATMLAVIQSSLSGAMPEALRPFSTILFTLRLPRTVIIAVSGAALAGSGAAYQGLFRNPLADPYLIGVASGAGLGAILAMTLKVQNSLLGMFSVPLAAFLGAMLTVGIVYEMARVGRALPVTNLLLSGVALSSFATALTSFLMVSATGELRSALVWMLGGATMSGWQPVLAELPYVALGLGVLLVLAHPLNVMQVGDEQAQQLGLPVERVRLAVIVAASLTTAAAVSFCGIIGFVGLVVPHVVRMVWGVDYRRILPLSILCGAALLLFSDVLARVVLAPQELPVGIITSLGGAPFFLWVLRRSKNQNFW